MGKILETYLLPHPAIIIPEVGKGEERVCRDTIDAAEKVAQRISELRPETIIVITPHGPVFQDAICISVESKLHGSFGNFGHGEISFDLENNLPLIKKINEDIRQQGILVGQVDSRFAAEHGISGELDHGTLVPLYFVNQTYRQYKLVHITIGFLPYEELYQAGTAIKNAVEQSKENAVVIASGDLSHRLIPSAPAGYHKRGKEFDEILVDMIRHFNVEGIVGLDEDLIQCAGECGHRPIIMMLGTLDGYDVDSDVLSYEGPFGVGYSVAQFKVGKENEERKIAKKLVDIRFKEIQRLRSEGDAYVNLARVSLESYVKEHKIIKPSNDLPEEVLKNRAGVFVSLKMHGQLRGCIGTTAPTRENTAMEIVHNAISAGTQDPRFFPVEEDELEHLVYSVDVLKEPETIQSLEELNPAKYGVIVRAGQRSGLLLPNLEGIDTPEQQVSIALQKADVRQDEKYSMQRFEVVRHK